MHTLTHMHTHTVTYDIFKKLGHEEEERLEKEGLPP